MDKWIGTKTYRASVDGHKDGEQGIDDLLHQFRLGFQKDHSSIVLHWFGDNCNKGMIGVI